MSKFNSLYKVAAYAWWFMFLTLSVAWCIRCTFEFTDWIPGEIPCWMDVVQSQDFAVYGRRNQCYIVGLLLGHFLHITKGKKINIPPAVNLLIWEAVLLLFFASHFHLFISSCLHCVMSSLFHLFTVLHLFITSPLHGFISSLFHLCIISPLHSFISSLLSFFIAKSLHWVCFICALRPFFIASSLSCFLEYPNHSTKNTRPIFLLLHHTNPI